MYMTVKLKYTKTVNIAYLEKSLQVQLYLEFGITGFYRIVFGSAVLAERPEIWIYKVSKYEIGEFGMDIIFLIIQEDSIYSRDDSKSGGYVSTLLRVLGFHHKGTSVRERHNV